jgi:hypothetical protein
MHARGLCCRTTGDFSITRGVSHTCKRWQKMGSSPLTYASCMSPCRAEPPDGERGEVTAVADGRYMAFCHAGLSRLMESEAKRLVEGALAVAKDIVQANRQARAGGPAASPPPLCFCMPRCRLQRMHAGRACMHWAKPSSARAGRTCSACAELQSTANRIAASLRSPALCMHALRVGRQDLAHNTP